MEEIKERIVNKKQFYLQCRCGEEIKGTSQSHVLHNLREHCKTQHKLKGEINEDNNNKAVATSDSSNER